MTYSNASPQSRLNDRRWRLRHSAWTLAVILGIGVFSFIGFVYCAIRVRTKKWWMAAAISATLSAGGWVLMELFTVTDSEGSTVEAPGLGDDFAVGYVLVTWIGMTVYALVVNRDYLRWRAGSEPNAWYRQEMGSHVSPMPQMEPTGTGLNPTSNEPSASAGVDEGDYFATRSTDGNPWVSSPTPVRIDINSSDARVIEEATGLPATTASRIVTARTRLGGFRDIHEITREASLQPHELLRLRDRVVFGPRQEPAPSPASQPRTSDEPPTHGSGGRILDF